MTTSGTTTYSVNETTLIQDAYETATIYDAGSSVSPDDYALARRKLNMIAKQLSGSSDYSPGLKMWARKTGYLFLAKTPDHIPSDHPETTAQSLTPKRRFTQMLRVELLPLSFPRLLE